MMHGQKNIKLKKTEGLFTHTRTYTQPVTHSHTSALVNSGPWGQLIGALWYWGFWWLWIEDYRDVRGAASCVLRDRRQCFEKTLTSIFGSQKYATRERILQTAHIRGIISHWLDCCPSYFPSFPVPCNIFSRAAYSTTLKPGANLGLGRLSGVPRIFFRGGGLQQIQLRTERKGIWGR